MKKLLVLALLVAMLVPVFAGGASEATSAPKADKTKVVFTVAGNPYRFFHLTSAGCGGDDNIVLANVYDNLLCLENDGSLSYSLAESYDISADGTVYTFHLMQDQVHLRLLHRLQLTTSHLQPTKSIGEALRQSRQSRLNWLQTQTQ